MQLSENKLHLSTVHDNLKKKHFKGFFPKHFLHTHRHTNSYTKYRLTEGCWGWKYLVMMVVFNCKGFSFSLCVYKFICAIYKQGKYSRGKFILWLQPNKIKMFLQKTNEGPLPNCLKVDILAYASWYTWAIIPCPKSVR